MFAARFDPSAGELGVKRTAEEAGLESEAEELESEKSSEESEESEESEDSDESDESDESTSDPSSDDEENSKPQNKSKEDIEIDEASAKHVSVLKRFQQIKQIQSTKESESENEEEAEQDEPLETHDVAPLPQPELPKDSRIPRNLSNNSLNWLASPQYIKINELKPFSEFDLNPQLLSNLKELEFENAFSVQIKTLEILLPEINNRLNPNAIKGDLLVNASTGSGKTIAYCLPILQSLSKRIVPQLKCIILVPTKPLINQVLKTMIQLSKGFNLNIVSLGKNETNLADEHEKLVKNVPDIIISTPGRFIDHLNLKSFNLNSLEWCIIDEADKLLNQSYQDWLNILIMNLNQVKADSNSNILTNFKKPVTKMIFSATLTTDSGKLINLNFNNPRLIIVNNNDDILTSDKIFQLPVNLKEFSIKLSNNQSSYKPLYLINFIKSLSSQKDVLIFTKSNESTLRLSKLLQLLAAGLKLDLAIDNINSSLSKSIKNKKLLAFEKGEINILISTDLISRGIDISTIKTVINYDLPNSSREYVHRVGRTARAQNNGDAYSFIVGNQEFKYWKSFNNDINRTSEITEFTIEKANVENDQDIQVYKECLKELEKQVFNK